MSNQLDFRFSPQPPIKSPIKNFFQVLSNKEKFVIYTALLILLASILIWAGNYYYNATEKVPDFGGEYTEGMIGEPIYINPILSQTNEVDSSLSQLIFSSLLKYDNQGNLVNDLAENYEVTDNGSVYTFKINPAAKWHDNVPLTANDIFFTVKLIQDPAYKSSLRGLWQDIQVNVVDDQTISFKLNTPYAPFLNKLTFGILPQHLFEQVPADKFLLNDLNLKPVGSGPYVYSEYKKDDDGNIISYHLLANDDYYHGRPYLDRLNFNFYSNEDLLTEAYNKKEVNGFGVLSYQKIDDFKNRKDSQIISLKTPRYFAVFFNQTKSKPLADKEVRRALAYATDRQAIIADVFAGYAQEVYSPILGSFGQFSSANDLEKNSFDLNKAEETLDKAGWKKQADGSRQKDGVPLEISLITTQWPDLVRTAEVLKSQWEKAGVKVNLTNLAVSDIQQNYIRPREYQSILFGQEYFGNDPDPYFFWHSSGKKDPGTNIAVYQNDKVDKLLDEARLTQDLPERQAKYAEFEKLLVDDAPAVFLYEPNYVYVTNKKIKGIETQFIVNTAYRFIDANHWYIKTKRIKKASAENN